jgi:hypothetical protein
LVDFEADRGCASDACSLAPPSDRLEPPTQKCMTLDVRKKNYCDPKRLFSLTENTFSTAACTMSLTNASPIEAAQAARFASRKLAILPAAARNTALTAVHDALLEAKDLVLEANAQDLTSAAKAVQSGQLSQSLVKRLDLGRKGKYEDMLQGILDVQALEDPSEHAATLYLRN